MRFYAVLIITLFIFILNGCGSRMVVIKSPAPEQNPQKVVLVEKDNTVASQNHLTQAKKFFVTEKFKQAQKHCEKAIEFDHRNWEAHYYMGLILQKQREYTVAIEKFGVCLKYCPNNKFVKSEIHFAIGFSWEQLGRSNDANKEYTLALEFNPSNLEASNAKNRLKVDKTVKNWGKKAKNNDKS